MTSAPSTTAEAIALIEAASGPDDLFGSDAARAYRLLAQLTHPDAHPGDRLVALRSYGPTAAEKRAVASALLPGIPATRR